MQINWTICGGGRYKFLYNFMIFRSTVEKKLKGYVQLQNQKPIVIIPCYFTAF